ncbi:hypothetical protein AU490_04710 [Lonsdalea populi]|nr:hypothetical protein AU499_09720 [Lonsdalea populi]RAT17166.1 hypothetical protein AU486_05750 [Lonsdalea quercina]RAT17556.1 hypothetical protein AU487_15670 [Lonsdalea populi]RAT29222.1 hypothetical protein AU489_00575 [Lonsdalea populi]RAT29968.1 hypothetical protein AU490_04710 [Lonsdalea populi]
MGQLRFSAVKFHYGLGILLDRKDLYDSAVDYYKNGEGNGDIRKLNWKLYPEQGMGQIQVSGSDQAHL